MGADGAQSVHGAVLEVDRPRRFALTWHASWDGGARTVISYTLEPTATGTEVSVVHDGFGGRPQSCESHA
nr:SRPBCC domain-containing protein [Myxococcota bacterium]